MTSSASAIGTDASPAVASPATLVGLLETLVRHSAERIAIVDGLAVAGREPEPRSWTWGEVAAAAVHLAGLFDAAGFRPGDRVADLYAGVGLFTAFLADRVGAEGTVVSVEADTQAARDARRSLHRYEQVRLVSATTEQALRHDADLRRGVDLVVLDVADHLHEVSASAVRDGRHDWRAVG